MIYLSDRLASLASQGTSFDPNFWPSQKLSVCLRWLCRLGRVKGASSSSGVITPFYRLWSRWHWHFTPGCRERIVPGKMNQSWSWQILHLPLWLANIQCRRGQNGYMYRCYRGSERNNEQERRQHMLVTLLLKGWVCTRDGHMKQHTLTEEWLMTLVHKQKMWISLCIVSTFKSDVRADVCWVNSRRWVLLIIVINMFCTGLLWWVITLLNTK